MWCIDEKFHKREQKVRRSYAIEDDLYEKVRKLVHIYEANINDLVNAALEYFIESETISLYEKPESSCLSIHTFSIRESTIIGLEKLKGKYGLNIYRLVNIALKNVLDEYDL